MATKEAVQFVSIILTLEYVSSLLIWQQDLPTTMTGIEITKP